MVRAESAGLSASASIDAAAARVRSSAVGHRWAYEFSVTDAMVAPRERDDHPGESRYTVTQPRATPALRVYIPGPARYVTSGSRTAAAQPERGA
jgi:hypothetical protein